MDIVLGGKQQWFGMKIGFPSNLRPGFFIDGFIGSFAESHPLIVGMKKTIVRFMDFPGVYRLRQRPPGIRQDEIALFPKRPFGSGKKQQLVRFHVAESGFGGQLKRGQGRNGGIFPSYSCQPRFFDPRGILHHDIQWLKSKLGQGNRKMWRKATDKLPLSIDPLFFEGRTETGPKHPTTTNQHPIGHTDIHPRFPKLRIHLR